MSAQRNNRRRLLSEVVALDAWHSPIRVDRNTTQVSVELTFKEGRLGGDDAELPFTFLLAVKRATLQISLEAPLSVDRRSVARDVPTTQGEQTTIREVRDEARAELSSGVNLDIAKFSAKAGAKGVISGDTKQENKVKFIQSIPRILSTGEPIGPKEYRWILESSYDEYLLGQPWDPVAHPRLSARYDASKLAKLEPTIKVELFCKFEDLVIANIIPKDQSLAERVKLLFAGDARLASAHQHLKHLLTQADLEAGRMDNRFASLVLGNVLSGAEVD